ncbi:hypothetical protein [Streptomyces sp. A5-4]|uniref:hypothetical protein n=1 Tax=Streptomyces sp. A5-4 TaxID=3384771 RepID=UPI003DA7F6D9
MTTEHPSGFDDGLSLTGRPRLGIPALASTSLYVQPLTPTGTMENQRTATAFVVMNRAGDPSLVTNRHVVTGRNSKNGNASSGDAVTALRVMTHATMTGIRDGSNTPSTAGAWTSSPSLESDFEEHEPIDLICYKLDGPPCARLELTTALFVIGYHQGFDPFKTRAALGVSTRGIAP